MPLRPGVDVADRSAWRARGLDHAAGRGVDDGGDAARLRVERVLPGGFAGHGVPQLAPSARVTISRTSFDRSGVAATRAIAARAAPRYGSASLRPAVQRARDARGELRVDARRARARGRPRTRSRRASAAVEAAGLPHAERADQAARAVRVGDGEVGVAAAAPARARRPCRRARARSACSENHLSTTSGSSLNSAWKRSSAGVGELASRRRAARRARLGGRSCCDASLKRW